MLRHASLTIAAGLATILAALSWQALGTSPAQAQSAAALTGQVSSAEEGNMEGVIVSARKDASNMTVSVVTNAQGRFSFPSDRLSAGHYAISTRAVGYDLDGPTAADIA